MEEKEIKEAKFGLFLINVNARNPQFSLYNFVCCIQWTNINSFFFNIDKKYSLHPRM